MGIWLVGCVGIVILWLVWWCMGLDFGFLVDWFVS